MERRILTQKEMCEITNTTPSNMSKYLNGLKKPSLMTAKRIAETCNVPIEIFLEKDVQEQWFGKSYLEKDIDIYDRPKLGVSNV